MTKRANPVRSMRRLIVGALIVALLVPACGVFNVVSVIKEGQRVGIDPCSLIEKADAERILGAPVTDPAFLAITVFNGSEFLSCSFEKQDGPDVGGAIGLSTNAVTQKQLDTDARTAAKSISIGKEASWWVPYKGGELANQLLLDVLSEEGVWLKIFIVDGRREGEAILEDAESLAKPAVERIKKKFPGTYKPPASTIDHANPCPLLSLEEAQEFVGKSAEGIKPTPIETFGGRFGGLRGCSYPGEVTSSDNPWVPISLSLFKGKATIDEMKRIQGGGEIVKGLGAYAYWIPASLSVLTSNGDLLSVGLNLRAVGGGPSELSDDQLKALAVEIAKRVLPRIK